MKGTLEKLQEPILSDTFQSAATSFQIIFVTNIFIYFCKKHTVQHKQTSFHYLSMCLQNDIHRNFQTKYQQTLLIIQNPNSM